nr:MAG TPA: hypothetical protein [Bacteriophage sp.]
MSSYNSPPCRTKYTIKNSQSQYFNVDIILTK